MKSTEYFILKKLEDGYKLNLLNSWNKETIPNIIEEIKSLKFHPNKKMYIDFQDLKELDSIAIIYLITLKSMSKFLSFIKNIIKMSFLKRKRY